MERETKNNTIKKAVLAFVLIFSVVCAGDGARITRRVEDYELEAATETEKAK